MATETVKSLFDRYCADLKIDAMFIRRLQRYRQGFANKNEDHVAFFGGNLMGVQEVKFVPSDRVNWFENVLLLDDEYDLQQDLLQLQTLVPDRLRIRYVSTDVMNLSCLWLVHAIHRSNLPARDKLQGMTDALLVLQYKFITSILAHWFPYRADEAVATATYASLDKSYKLKELGSWGALLEYRAERTLNDKPPKPSPHLKTIDNFEDDYGVVYMVNDIQGRIKNYLHHIRDRFEIIRHDPSALIRTTSNTVVIDGEALVKNKKNVYSTYRRYLNDVLTDRNSFIIKELVDIVVASMPKLQKAPMVDVLEYMTRQSGLKGDPNVSKLLDLTLEHLFEFINNNRRNINVRDIPALLSKLRNLYTASRGVNPLLLDIRVVGEAVVRKSVKRLNNPSKNAALAASVRTSVLLYLVLRTMTMNYYRKS